MTQSSGETPRDKPPNNPAPTGAAADDEPAVEAELDDDPPPQGPIADPPPAAGAAESAPSHDPEHDLAALAEAEAVAGAPAAYRPPLHRKKKGSPLKAIAVPILATIGLLLLAFAVYGVTLVRDPEASGREPENARNMGMLMIFGGGLISLCLLAGAAWFFVQVRREKTA